MLKYLQAFEVRGGKLRLLKNQPLAVRDWRIQLIAAHKLPHPKIAAARSAMKLAATILLLNTAPRASPQCLHSPYSVQ
jgi:hypothetical protein